MYILYYLIVLENCLKTNEHEEICYISGNMTFLGDRFVCNCAHFM